MLKEDVQKIMAAREAVCPSIILTFHNSYMGFSDGTFVIDYVQEEYSKRSQVIRDYIMYGNSTDRLKGYGSQFVFNVNNPEFHVKYYFDVSSYLIDPEQNAPINSRASTYKEINIDNRPDLKNILVQFQAYLEKEEDINVDRMDPEENRLFYYEEFSRPSEVNDILSRNQPINSFDEIINHTDYFNTNLF